MHQIPAGNIDVSLYARPVSRPIYSLRLFTYYCSFRSSNVRKIISELKLLRLGCHSGAHVRQSQQLVTLSTAAIHYSTRIREIPTIISRRQTSIKIVNTCSDEDEPLMNKQRAILVPINRSVDQSLSVGPTQWRFYIGARGAKPPKS